MQRTAELVAKSSSSEGSAPEPRKKKAPRSTEAGGPRATRAPRRSASTEPAEPQPASREPGPAPDHAASRPPKKSARTKAPAATDEGASLPEPEILDLPRPAADPTDPLEESAVDLDAAAAADEEAILQEMAAALGNRADLDPATGALQIAPQGPLPEPPIAGHHVIIVGRTVAGYTAAIELARSDESMKLALLAGMEEDPVGLTTDLIWTSDLGRIALAELELNTPVQWIDDVPLRFTNADASKIAAPPDMPAVHLARTADLLASLHETAKAVGVDLPQSPPARITLRDRQAEVQLATGRNLCAHLLIYADNTIGRPLLDTARLRTPLQSLRPNWSIYGLSAPSATKTHQLTIVVGWQGRAELGSIVMSGSKGSLFLPELRPSDPIIAKQLIEQLVRAKQLPPGTQIKPPTAQRRRFLPGSSLEFDQHFGKCCLLIGQCGGFSSALSGETIFASARLARIIANLVGAALRSPQPQDMLSHFELQWRSSLADYLRLPNTDLQFILPVIFTNEQIARKIAAGFVKGENL